MSEREPAPLYVEGLEQLVLAIVYRLGRKAYGVTVWKSLVEAGRESSLGSIYATLDRLEEKRLVTSRQGEPTKERGGRSKKYFGITGNGVEALNASARVYGWIIPADGFSLRGVTS